MYRFQVAVTDGCSIAYDEIVVTVDCVDRVWQFTTSPDYYTSDTIRTHLMFSVTIYVKL